MLATAFSILGGIGRVPRLYRLRADGETPRALAIDFTVRLAEQMAVSNARRVFWFIRSLGGSGVQDNRWRLRVTQIVTGTGDKTAVFQFPNQVPEGISCGKRRDSGEIR